MLGPTPAMRPTPCGGRSNAALARTAIFRSLAAAATPSPCPQQEWRRDESRRVRGSRVGNLWQRWPSLWC